MTEYRTNRYAGACDKCGREVPAGGGRLDNKAGRWVVAHATPAECQSAPAPVARRSGYSGELWQECEARGCGTEPVCINCFRCFDHCHCPPPPTGDELAREKAERQAKRERATAAREALLARIDTEGFDPLSVPIQRQGHTGTFGTNWPAVTEPEQIASYLDDALTFEVRVAEHKQTEPRFRTRAELLRFLVASGAEVHWDSDWNDTIRFRPEGAE